MAGELWTISDVISVMNMPVLAKVLEERGMRLQQVAVEQLLLFAGTRTLAAAIKQAGGDVEAMGEQEIAEGAVRVAVSEAAAERSAQLSVTSVVLAAKGVDEVATAAAAGQVAKAAAKSGVAEIAKGAEAVGAGEAAAATGEALAARAAQ